MHAQGRFRLPRRRPRSSPRGDRDLPDRRARCQRSPAGAPPCRERRPARDRGCRGPSLPGGLPARARPAPRRCPTRCSSRAPTRPAATRSRSSARRSPTSPPQILMEQDLHGPGIDRQGRRLPGREPLRPARPRPRLRVERHVRRPGHHRHLRGAAVRRDASTTRFRGQCLPIEVLERKNALDAEPGRLRRRPARRRCTPSARSSASSPAAATYKGKQVLYTVLRSTYLHEVDSARRLQRCFNDPARSAAPGLPARGRQHRLHVQLVLHRRQAHRLLQLGQQPGAGEGDDRAAARSASTNEWRDFNPDLNTARYTPFAQHPQVDRPAVPRPAGTTRRRSGCSSSRRASPSSSGCSTGRPRGRERATSARGSAGRSRRGAVAAGAFERPQPLRRRPGARL